MNKNPVYRVVSTFRAAGTDHLGRAVSAQSGKDINYPREKGNCGCGDPDCDNGKESDGAFENRCRSIQLLPVNGIPMRAKDTLLAQLCKSTKFWAAKDQVCGLINHSNSERDAFRNVKQACFPNIPSGRRGTPYRIEPPTPTKSQVDMVLGNQSLRGKVLSVEIECYPAERSHFRSTKSTNKNITWCGTDGSIGDRGIEIRKMTFSKDKNGRLVGLLGLKRGLKGASVDNKCGLHVHVDARHLPDHPDHPTLNQPETTYDQLTKLYPALKQLVPENRWTNKYCQFENNRPNSRNSNEQVGRYAAINWHSYPKYGTIEFRLAPGSTNIVKIESWALLCQHLLQWCSQKGNTIPTTFEKMMVILPEWLGTWCTLRRQKLHGDLKTIPDERALSACDVEDGMTVE